MHDCNGLVKIWVTLAIANGEPILGGNLFSYDRFQRHRHLLNYFLVCDGYRAPRSLMCLTPGCSDQSSTFLKTIYAAACENMEGIQYRFAAAAAGGFLCPCFMHTVPPRYLNMTINTF
jgi:hypothetical protein